MTAYDNLNKKIIQWGSEYLSSHGYTLKNTPPEAVQNTPWSFVVRFMTSDGYIYLKHTPKLIALEASIIQILDEQFHISVPKVIANNTELNCFLMKDAGSPLRELLKKQFDVTLLYKALDQFTSMQIVVADYINVFLDIGVPDWRLDKLPDLYMQLLSQSEMLSEDGLLEDETSELKNLVPKVYDLCKKLSAYSIKPSIVQPDFNDNNTLINDITKNMKIIDLGEIVISHPFFSLINFLRQAKKHHALTDKDDAYLQLVDACLKNYMAFSSKKDLLDAFAIAGILWFIYEALAQYRLRTVCDNVKFTAFQRHGKLRDTLKNLLPPVILYNFNI